MDPNWSRLKELFAAALEQPAQSRDAWLREHCSNDATMYTEVASLLAAHAQPANAFLIDGGERLASSLLADAELAEPDADVRIGPYHLLRLLGEGGMGRVFLAERVDGQFRQHVALKLIRAEFASHEARERFLRERDILARLTHPNIAQLHDGGLSQQGTPYFTLEYVEGEPITRWCDTRKASISERVELMLKVCDAVQYAHRNLVVHRDLKPSNILVTAAGEPKLLDFGIAKPLDDGAQKGLTGTHAQPMTREYAAPEQVLGGSITTATDVYTLGVLLYELLCGHSPYARAENGDRSWPEAIVEDLPESLSRALVRTSPGAADANLQAGEVLASTRGTMLTILRRKLRGDLDRIVQRALAKEPEARYPSVTALAEDLLAWVEQRPISGGTRSYRLRKYMSRHWLPLSAAAALLLALIAGTLGIAWEAQQRAEQAELALHQARAAAAMKDFLLSLFTAIDPREAKGREISAHEIVDRGAARIGHDSSLDSAQRAEFESVLGRIYFQLGHYDQAKTLQQSATQGLKGDAAQRLLLVRTQMEQANSTRALGDLKSAAALASDASEQLKAMPDASAADRARALNVQGAIAMDGRDFDGALRYANAELALAQQAQLETSVLYDASMLAGGASWGLNHLDDAEGFYRRALEIALRGNDPDDLRIARARLNAGIVLQRKSHYEEARQQEIQAQALFTKVLGQDHPDALQSRRDLGLSYFHLGRYAEARDLLEKVAATQRTQLGADHPALAGTFINLGLVQADSGDLDGAEQTFDQAIEIFQKRYGREFDGTVTAISNLGYVHLLKGQLDRAQNELTEVKTTEAKHGTTDDVANDYRLGEVARQHSDLPTALTLEHHALESGQKTYGENSRYTALAHHYLALALRDSGNVAGAERELRAALASFAGYISKAEHPLAATTRIELGSLLAQHPATHAEAIKLVSEAVTLREQFLGKDDARTRQASALLERLKTAH